MFVIKEKNKKLEKRNEDLEKEVAGMRMLLVSKDEQISVFEENFEKFQVKFNGNLKCAKFIYLVK